VIAAGSAGVVVVGGGLAGSLLALELRELGASVTLVDAPAEAGRCSASAISYGALPGWPLAPTPLARLATRASRSWRRLQQRHGPLGWRPCRLRLHSAPPWWARASAWLPVPFAQVDTAVLAARLPAVLAAAGVVLQRSRLERLDPAPARGWRLQLADGSVLSCRQLVLAAGASCRELWPALPQRLRSSWAGVLELGSDPRPVAAPLARPQAWLPARFARVDLERRTAGLRQPEWRVDGGLVPWGQGALLGQHSLVRPGLELGPAPAAADVEQQLRQALATQAWATGLAAEPGRLHQAAVAFCTDGLPLVGPAAGADGLWLFTGFSAGFSQVPVLVPLLAQALRPGGGRAAAATRRLRQLGVWLPEQAGAPDPAGPDRVP
jgi:glycine/D-amino acid oxidase-like deaminating enzyme